MDNTPKNDPVVKNQALSTKKVVELLLDGTIRENVCKFCLKLSSPLYELDRIFKLAGKRALYKVTVRDMISSFYPFQVILI